MTADREKKIIDKCLRCYGRKKSLLRVEEFLNRIHESSDLYFEKTWPAIRQQFYPDLTMDRLLEYALNCYRGCPEAEYCSPNAFMRRAATLKGGAAMAYIYYLVREETPLTPFEFEEFKGRFEVMLKKEPVPPTKEDWDSLASWLL